MALRNTNSTNISLNSLCFVIGIIIFSMTTQLTGVDCRALCSTQLIPATRIERVDEAEDTTTESRLSSFSITRCSSLRSRMRNLGYKLASGPSKRGPGH
ncbi:unnamed protein product [Lactuca virosa]|uniref:Secreted protein n=1 Tax=Lactuca virosa TaxID=75947 RepID=A0AAU9PW67_9ASTR|nr:unnamed protein product [Lactuca virosa]